MTKQTPVSPRQCFEDLNGFRRDIQASIDDMDDYLKGNLLLEHVVPNYIQTLKLLRRSVVALDACIAATQVGGADG